jgi:hypothetical protein
MLDLPVRSHNGDSKEYADAVAKIFDDKIVDHGWNRWLIGASKMDSWNYDWRSGRLTVALRVDGAVIESGTVTIGGRILFDGVRTWYFTCTDVTARSDQGNPYVMFGANLEDHVKPLLTYVVVPNSTTSVIAALQPNPGMEPAPAVYVTQVPQMSASAIAAYFTSLEHDERLDGE